MILVALSYIVRIDLVRGNYIKLYFILVTNIVAVAVFLLSGLSVLWLVGGALFLGQVAGAMIGSWVALTKGETWIKAILVVCILLSSAKLLGVI